MKVQHFILFLALTVHSVFALAQTRTISGYIRDKDTYEVLSSANFFEVMAKAGVASNSSGYYSFTLPAGKVTIQASHVGYQPVIVEFNLQSDTTINFLLSIILLDEVVITSGQTATFKQSATGINIIPASTIKSIPSLIGEPDIIRAVTFIPGVSEGREGIAGFYVRGGDRGQNLILLDGAKIYNTNHLGGFVSLFNSDIIKSADMYKGGFPSRFGGRASSVLDIHTKEGNKHEFHSKFKVGILQSSLLCEGPLKSQRTSYLVAIRASYFDLLLLPLRIKVKADGRGDLFGYTFADINLKVNHEVNNKNKLFANFYSGLDLQGSSYNGLNEASDDDLLIRTNLLTLGHTFVPGKKTFLKNSLIISGYGNRISAYYSENTPHEQYFTRTSSQSSIRELTFKSILDWNPDVAHSIKAGAELNNYSFLPGKLHQEYEDLLIKHRFDTIFGTSSWLKSSELSLFFEDDYTVCNALKVYAGIRSSGYFYKKSVNISLEPRLSLRLMLSENVSAKISYTRMTQYNHSLWSNYQGFERDVWIASTDSIPAQTANQYSGGVYGNLTELNTEFGLEVYYKNMNDLIDYNSTSSNFDDFSNVNSRIVRGGRGWSYGLEFMASRDISPVFLSLSYALSWSYRQFDELNNGEKFPSRFDRRHNLSIVARYKPDNKYVINAQFHCSTGTPFTLPESYVNNNRFSYGYFLYSGINNMRLPLYHRLDLGIDRKGKTKKGNVKTTSLNFYNVYARQNPVYIYYSPGTGKVYQKCLFSIIPSITYSIEF